MITTLSGSIGLNDMETEGTWVWSDGTPLDWEHWALDEPNDPGAGEDCGMFWPQGEWNDDSCFKPLPFVCSMP